MTTSSVKHIFKKYYLLYANISTIIFNKYSSISKLLKILSFLKLKNAQLLSLNETGIVCLKMIAAYYGKDYSVESLKSNYLNTQPPMRLEDIGIAAEHLGFKCTVLKINYRQLVEEVHFPLILPWKQGQFIVLYDAEVSFWRFLPWVSKEEKFVIADPMENLIVVDKKTFLLNWMRESEHKAFVLLFES
jgi:ATP-binding cassette, subfamily B, bacterial